MFLILPLILVIICTPSMNRKSKSLLSMYPLSPHSLPHTFSTNEAFFKEFRSSVLSGVIMKLSNSPLSLMMICSLNPKNHPIEHFPLWHLGTNRSSDISGVAYGEFPSFNHHGVTINIFIECYGGSQVTGIIN